MHRALDGKMVKVESTLVVVSNEEDGVGRVEQNVWYDEHD